VNGIEFLYQLKKEKNLPHCLIITVGTGTSMISRKERFEHIGGSALGGGFFMALINLLYKIDNFDDAIISASKGNRYNVDLKVGDIYSLEDNRVNSIFRQFTAASLGKINSSFKIEDYQKEDLLNSIICMIGENVGTIAIEKAKSYEIDNLVFCGGFLRNNKPIQKLLSLLCSINQMKSIFLEHSIFAGAIGMLLE
jgi:type II pantothenate kinase